MLMEALTTMMMASDTRNDKWRQAFLSLTPDGREMTGRGGRGRRADGPGWTRTGGPLTYQGGPQMETIYKSNAV